MNRIFLSLAAAGMCVWIVCGQQAPQQQAPQQLTPEQQQQVQAQIEAMTKSIVNKIAHGPISALRRNAGQPDGDQFVEAVRKVFHLQD